MGFGAVAADAPVQQDEIVAQPGGTTVRDEWLAAINNPGSAYFAQKDEELSFDYMQRLLFWRIHLFAHLSLLPSVTRENWGREFSSLASITRVVVSSTEAGIAKENSKKPFYYVAGRGNHPALYRLVERTAKSLGQQVPLVTIVDHPGTPITIFVAQGEGETSLITIGRTLFEMTDDDLLEGLLAHEFAHVKQKHIRTKITFGKAPDVLRLLLLVLGFVIAVKTKVLKPTVKHACVTAALFGFMVLYKKLPAFFSQKLSLWLSRYLERDADKHGALDHPPAAAQLVRAMRYFKNVYATKRKQITEGAKHAHSIMARYVALPEYAKETLTSFINTTEEILQQRMTACLQSHPSPDERIDFFQDFQQKQGKQ